MKTIIPGQWYWVGYSSHYPDKRCVNEYARCLSTSREYSLFNLKELSGYSWISHDSCYSGVAPLNHFPDIDSLPSLMSSKGPDWAMRLNSAYILDANSACVHLGSAERVAAFVRKVHEGKVIVLP